MNNYQQPVYGAQPQPQQMYGGYDPNFNQYAYGNGYMVNGAFQPTTYMYNPTPMPMNTQSISEEEIQKLQSSNGNKFDLNVPEVEFIRAMCNHKHNGMDVAQQVNDSTGDVWCPICNERWNPELISKEQAKQLVDAFVNQLQIMKWVGNFPVEVIRDYFTLIPLLRKFPDLLEIASNNYKKYANGQTFVNANNNSIYNQYELLMGRGAYTQAPYMVSPQMGGYYGQPIMPQNMQVMQQYGAAQPQQQGYYGQSVQQTPPNVNPMQMQPGQQQTVFSNAPQPYAPQGMYNPQPMMNQPMGGPQPFVQPAMQPMNNQQPMMNQQPAYTPVTQFNPLQQQSQVQTPQQPQAAVQSTPEQVNGATAQKDQTVNL